MSNTYATLENMLKQKIIIEELKETIDANTDKLVNDETGNNNYIRECALYITLCDYLKTNTTLLISIIHNKVKFYAIRILLKMYIASAKEIWTYCDLNDSNIINFFQDNCGCNNPSMILQEEEEWFAFLKYGPGHFINTTIEHIEITDVVLDIARNNIIAWRLWVNDDTNISETQFNNNYALFLEKTQNVWKHSKKNIFSILIIYKHIFSQPHNDDLKKINDKLTFKLNADCAKCIIGFL